MTEQEYRKKDAISQSYLTLLDRHPNLAKRYIDGEYSLGDHEDVKIGDAVDTLLTKGREEFEENFEVIEENIKPTGNMLELTKLIHKDTSEDTLEDKILHYHGVLDMKRPSREKIVTEFYEKAKTYFDKISSEKSILTYDQNILIRDIVDSLKNNDFTGPILSNPDIKYQIPVFFEYEGEDCKGLLDMCLFDEDNKVITPYDLKITSYSLYSFESTIFSKRYDLQAEFYYIGFKNNFPQYTISPYFRFIIESSKFPGTPLIYKYKCRGDGSGITKDGKYYKGIVELLDDNKYHRELDRWDYKREVLENDGVIEVN